MKHCVVPFLFVYFVHISLTSSQALETRNGFQLTFNQMVFPGTSDLDGIYVRTFNLTQCDGLESAGTPNPGLCSGCTFPGCWVFKKVGDTKVMYLDATGKLTIRDFLYPVNATISNPCFNNLYLGLANSPRIVLAPQPKFRQGTNVRLDTLTTSGPGSNGVAMEIVNGAMCQSSCFPLTGSVTIIFKTPAPSRFPTSTPITSAPSRFPTTPTPSKAPSTTSPSLAPTPKPTKNPVKGQNVVISNCEGLLVGGQWASAWIGNSQGSPIFNRLNMTSGQPIARSVWTNNVGITIRYLRLLDQNGHWVIGNSTFSLISSAVLDTSGNITAEPHGGTYNSFPHGNVLQNPTQSYDLVFTCSTGSFFPTRSPVVSPPSTTTTTQKAGQPTFAPTVACAGDGNGLTVTAAGGLGTAGGGTGLQGNFYQLPTQINGRTQYEGVGGTGSTNEQVRLFHDAVTRAWVFHIPAIASQHQQNQFTFFYPGMERGPPMGRNLWFEERNQDTFNIPLPINITLECYNRSITGSGLQSRQPTGDPTARPTGNPVTAAPSRTPSKIPSFAPTTVPSVIPTAAPTNQPTSQPTTLCATLVISGSPPALSSLNGQYRQSKANNLSWVFDGVSGQRVFFSRSVSLAAWIIAGPAGYMASQVNPTFRPPLNSPSPWDVYLGASPFSTDVAQITAICLATLPPSPAPTSAPSKTPTTLPTAFPTFSPSVVPSNIPTTQPTSYPSKIPTTIPTATPSSVPSDAPSAAPTSLPNCTFLSVYASIANSPVMFATGLYRENSTAAYIRAGYRTWAMGMYRVWYDTTRNEFQIGMVGQKSVWALSSPARFRPPASASWFQRFLTTGFGMQRRRRRRLLSGNMTSAPSSVPSGTPSRNPTGNPTKNPTTNPVTTSPTSVPSSSPTVSPVVINTTCAETLAPTRFPTQNPTSNPTMYPTNQCLGLRVSGTNTFSGDYYKQPTLLQGKAFWQTATKPTHVLRWHINQWILSNTQVDGSTLWASQNINSHFPRGMNLQWYRDYSYGGGTVKVNISCFSTVHPTKSPSHRPSSPPTVNMKPMFTNCPNGTIQFAFAKPTGTTTAPPQPAILVASAKLWFKTPTVKDTTSATNLTTTCSPVSGSMQSTGGKITITCTATDDLGLKDTCSFEAQVMHSTMSTLEVCRRYGPHVSVVMDDTTKDAKFELAIPSSQASGFQRSEIGVAYIPGQTAQAVEPCYVYSAVYTHAAVEAAVAAAAPPTSTGGSGSTSIFGGGSGSSGSSSGNLIVDIIVIVLLVLVICLCCECLRRMYKDRQQEQTLLTEPMLNDQQSLTAMAGVANEEQMRRATVTNQIQEKTRSEVPASSGFAPSKRMASAKDLGVEPDEELEMVAPASPKMMGAVVATARRDDNENQPLRDDKLQSGAFEYADGEVPIDRTFWQEQLNNLVAAGYPNDTKNLKLLTQYAVRDTTGDVDRERTQHLVHNVLWHQSTATTPGGGQANDIEVNGLDELEDALRTPGNEGGDEEYAEGPEPEGLPGPGAGLPPVPPAVPH